MFQCSLYRKKNNDKKSKNKILPTYPNSYLLTLIRDPYETKLCKKQKQYVINISPKPKKDYFLEHMPHS